MVASIGILFSGGVDCSVIARLVHEVLPPQYAIDLINVAFENPRITAARKLPAGLQAYDDCPDRVTGNSSFAELCSICPNRRWRFVNVNVPYSEVLEHRSTIISLMHPHDTEMDFSISLALYFASRGRGFITGSDSDQKVPYTTLTRILLSGLGADELFAGYTRHATAYSRKGYPGLNDELELDLCRIATRNLGRDDRIVNHWGREMRYPFLDDGLVRWALELPIWMKCGFAAGPPSDEVKISLDPSKLILRLLAWKLELRCAAQAKKRAIQFGARTAKMVAGKTKGTETIALSAGENSRGLHALHAHR